MYEWWINLEPMGMRTFVGIGAISSAVLFVQLLVVLIGGAIEVPDMDVGDASAGGATGMFSVRGIGAFFTGFGWTGATVLDSTRSLGLAVLVATLVGAVILAGFILLMRWLHSLRAEGTMDYSNAIGQVGSVYVPIPPRRSGLGQVEILVQGRMSTVRALNDGDERLENRVAVRALELIDERTLLVEPLAKKPSGDADEASPPATDEISS